MILSLEEVSLTYVEKPILNQVNWVINEKEKWGVIGLNGAGKSTLLKILAQTEKVDSGNVNVIPGIRISYCPQDAVFDSEDTVLQAVLKDLKKDEKVEEYEAKSILGKLGMNDVTLKIKILSGGQLKRVALARTLIKPADLYLLDEPTNHLDQGMICWLEKFLSRMNAGLVLVTHDRYFLSRITNHMVEVDQGKLYSYIGNYADFLEQKEKREERLIANERKRKSFLRTEIEWIRRGALARSTKSKDRIARFEKISEMEGIKTKEKLQMESASTRLGGKTIEMRGLSKSYGDKKLFEDFTYLVHRSDRVGIIGDNGAGKSTLLKMIMQEVKADTGTIEIGETVKIGYFAQTSALMDPNQRIIDYIKDIGEVVSTASGEMITASQMLERFLFSRDDQWNLIGKCSGGEKRRLYLLSILMKAPNILLLDEPTNDLDIETLTVLEDYLENFNGAVLAVSHDRYFLDKIADKLIVFKDGKIEVLTTDYSSYLESLENKRDNPNKKEEIKKETKTTKNKLNYVEKKELESLEGQLGNLEESIVKLENDLNDAGSDFTIIQRISQELESKRNELEEKTERWMELSEKEG